MPSLYFFTKKFFQKPSFKNYENKKSKFYQQEYSLNTLSTLEKWNELCENFSNLVDDKEVFKGFVERRKITEPGRFSVSLNDFLFFMENFYFLLKTENEYQLTQEQKNTLLAGIAEIYKGGVCEPGIATRCNELVVQFRSDMNWIDSELYKQRKNIIKLLADEYNALYTVSNGMSVHTHMCMQELGEEFKLGAQDDVKIDDVYLQATSSKKIKEFFKENYQSQFLAYQKESIDGLMAHLYSVFEKDYKSKFIKNDANIEVMDGEFNGKEFIPSENTKLFNDFLSKYLQGDSSTGFLTTAAEEENDYKFYLKEADELKQGLRDALLQKLIVDGFLIPSPELSQENIKLVHLFFNEKISPKLMQDFLQDFGDRTQFAKNFVHHWQKYFEILTLNTSFLLDLILSDTIAFDVFPGPIIKQHHFLTALVGKIAEIEDPKFEKLFREILSENIAYFTLFSEEQQLKLKTIFQDEFPELHINLKQYDLFGKILKGKVSWYQLKKYAFALDPFSLKNAVQEKKIECDGLSQDGLNRFCRALFRMGYSSYNRDNYFKLKARKGHLKLNNASYFTFKTYDEKLVLQAIEENNNWVDAIFAFQNSTPIYDLGFSKINSLQHHGHTTRLLLQEWLNSLIELIKKLAAAFILYKAYVFSSISEQYLIQFVNFCVVSFPISFYLAMLLIPFLSYYVLDSEIKIYNFISLTFLFFLPTLSLSLTINIFLCLYAMLPPLLAGLSSFFSERPWSASDIKLYLRQIFQEYWFIDILFFIRVFCLFAYDIPKHVIINWTQLLFAVLSSVILRSLETFKQYFSPNDRIDASINIENTIFRLQMMDDISANQKGNLLKNLWVQISKHRVEHPELSLQDALNKKYPIYFKGNQHEYSFNEIAKLKRIKGQEFALTPEKRWFSFFSTTTQSSISNLTKDMHPA